jgi:uncharacterized MnhB-related membrane protein
MTAEELVPLVIFATVAFLLVTGLIVAYFLFSHTRRNAVRRRASWIAAVSSGIVALFATLHFAIPALEDFRNPDVSFREALLGTDLTGVFCTSRGEREFTRRTAGHAQQEVQSGTDRNVAAAD